MRTDEMRYLPSNSRDQIDKLADQFTTGAIELTPEDFIERLKEILPVQKLKVDTVRRRVEGYAHVTDLLWDKAMEIGNLDRHQIVIRAKLRPLSHYHYTTGSREPAVAVRTRDDYMNDPGTALEKLKEDIRGLAGLINQLKAQTVID